MLIESDKGSPDCAEENFVRHREYFTHWMKVFPLKKFLLILVAIANTTDYSTGQDSK